MEQWFADSYLAIDQGPIVAMIENYRTGLLWDLFMNDADINNGLERLGFSSPHMEMEHTETPVIYDIGQFDYQNSKYMTDELLKKPEPGSNGAKSVYSKAS